MKDRVCVVTGGAGGIGRAVVDALCDLGARVAVVDKEPLSRDDVFFLRGDIAEAQVVSAFAAQVIDRFGRVDCLINNACLTRAGILSGCGADDFNYVLRVGVTAPYLLTRAFLGAFAPGASVVNLCSTRAFMSQPDTESYTAAKGGIASLTHALSVSLAGRVRVNAISPGWIETGAAPRYAPADLAQHPAGRVGTPADIVEAILFLCSERAGFITGQNLIVDGGMTRQMIYHGDEGWSFSAS